MGENSPKQHCTETWSRSYGLAGAITFACEDPLALAKFWATALAYDLEEPPPDLIEAIEAECGDPNAATGAVGPAGNGPWLCFKKMPRSSPDHIPIHLDLTPDDREVERRTELGANVIGTKTETIGPYTET